MREATIQFHALCEGLAALELRATFPPEDAERIWRDALTALISRLRHHATPATVRQDHHNPATHQATRRHDGQSLPTTKGISDLRPPPAGGRCGCPP